MTTLDDALARVDYPPEHRDVLCSCGTPPVAPGHEPWCSALTVPALVAAVRAQRDAEDVLRRMGQMEKLDEGGVEVRFADEDGAGGTPYASTYTRDLEYVSVSAPTVGEALVALVAALRDRGVTE